MTKQAVLLIHGIGEQKPMESLRSFVDAVWTTASGGLHQNYPGANAHWSKPYKLSKSFELRRLTTPENAKGIRTDFFELYWAHLMHGNRVGHVLSWARMLLWRYPWTVPKHLRLVYGLLIVLFVLGAFFVYQALVSDDAMLPKAVSGLAAVVVVPLITAVIANIVGDAARYLNPTPANVNRREEIRAKGFEVLKKLHDKRNGYDRIIVVGHSLGAVIGYDVLYHTWSEFNRSSGTNAGKTMDALNALEAVARDLVDGKGSHSLYDVQKAQRAYYEELKANGGQWRVTDFVTLGSPLTHAEVLLARDADDLREKQRSRELPRCLPELETSRHKPPKRLFSYLPDKDERVPHHAAVFAPTRWTNLYFPARFIVIGDMIGGPLARVFGKGINDVPVSTRKLFGFFSHTFYWKPDGKDVHIEKLRDALNLLDT